MNGTAPPVVRLELPRQYFEFIVRVLAETPLRFADVAPIMDELSRQEQASREPPPFSVPNPLFSNAFAGVADEKKASDAPPASVGTTDED